MAQSDLLPSDTAAAKPFVKPVPTVVRDPNALCEDTCRHIHGIDISHYQGNVFWQHLGENHTVKYVYIKATEGASRIDNRYERNIRMARQHGLKVGSYHFFRAKVPAMTQLKNFKAQCKAEEQDLIPMIDVESLSRVPVRQFLATLRNFLILVEREYGQKPLIYTGRNFYNKYLAGHFPDYKFMIAQYLDEEPRLKDGHDILMWQYTGKGSIKGVSGYVDKSRFMGTHTLNEIEFRR